VAKGKSSEAGWIVTFADLMALLLTFFVLLLSFSTMDAKKYDTAVESMGDAFAFHWRFFIAKSNDPDFGHDAKVVFPELSIPIPAVMRPETFDEAVEAVEEVEEFNEPVEVVQTPTEELYDALAGVLEAQIAMGGVDLDAAPGRVTIRFEEKVSFGSGRADLVATFKESLDQIRSVLEEMPGDIVVSGHTDDRPISTSQFRSNWDLSAARAVSVVHHLLDNTSIWADRIVAQGRADTVPLLPNDSERNRAKNRRVEISIGKADQ